MARFVVMLGPPGAGKGTQAKLLAKALDMPHVSSGDLFRDHLGRKTELGALAKQYMDRGDLVPDDVTVGMVVERISRALNRVGKPVAVNRNGSVVIQDREGRERERYNVVYGAVL